MASTLDMLTRLLDHDVELVLVGGMAGVVHGSSLVTQDVDVCTRFDTANLQRILGVLCDLQPRHRLHPEQPALSMDAAELAKYQNLYLTTSLGALDLLTEITGLGDFEEVAKRTVKIDIEGRACRVLKIDALIESKRAIGRDKDLLAVRQLESIKKRSGEEA